MMLLLKLLVTALLFVVVVQPESFVTEQEECHQQNAIYIERTDTCRICPDGLFADPELNLCIKKKKKKKV